MCGCVYVPAVYVYYAIRPRLSFIPCVVAFRIEFAWKHLRNNLATATEAAAAATPPHTHTHLFWPLLIHVRFLLAQMLQSH